ncbi:Gfo/Idh/MocA family protein [Paenibacillus koleovorans]|uniref:Gfo/Idh/MocA family protein n=1 Tax=Paenibacillus koleovorans TaxID=121608 RepID=UPI001FE76916|nr:Gfo/Idh/MocA family oxidoreductase [Paenibacillus koleovorans]
MNSKNQFSIIGCQHAHIHTFIAEMLALDYECVGIYEPEHLELARTTSDKFSIPIFEHFDPSQLLGEQIDVVGCAAINNRKIEIIELCEKQGKHIMLDKPAVTSRVGLTRLQAVAARGRIQIGMLLTERFRPSIYTLKRQIDEATLGRIVSIGMRKPHRLNPGIRPDWFYSRERSGGIVVDLLIHDFDLLRWLTGCEIVSSVGSISKHHLPERPDFYDTASVQVELEGGLVAQLYADWHTPDKSWTWGDGRIFINGTEGCAELRLSGDPFITADQPLLLQITNREAVTRPTLVQPPVTITRDFLNRIYGCCDVIVTQDDILLAMAATIEADEQVIVHYSKEAVAT